jgi:hypothetical protein
MMNHAQILTRSQEGARGEQPRIGRWEMLTLSAVALAAKRLFVARSDQDVDELLELDANTAASLPSCSRGLDIEVLEGSLLVTQSGDPDDHVLGAGDRARFGPRGVAAMAFRPSRVLIRAGTAIETVPQSPPWNGATSGSSLR